jgi:hypothetical protein
MKNNLAISKHWQNWRSALHRVRKRLVSQRSGIIQGVARVTAHHPSKTLVVDATNDRYGSN